MKGEMNELPIISIFYSYNNDSSSDFFIINMLFWDK